MIIAIIFAIIIVSAVIFEIIHYCIYLYDVHHRASYIWENKWSYMTWKEITSYYKVNPDRWRFKKRRPL